MEQIGAPWRRRMTPGEAAESVIDDLGIMQIEDLDVEAIAFDAGIQVCQVCGQITNLVTNTGSMGHS